MDSQKLTNAIIDETGRTYRKLVLTPIEASSSLVGRTLWSLGFVSKYAHNRKIQEVVDQANRFIHETVVSDRQVMVENQELSGERDISDILRSSNACRDENEVLKKKIADLEKTVSILKKSLETEQGKSMAEKKTLQEIQLEKELKEKELQEMKSRVLESKPKPNIVLYKRPQDVKPALTDEEVSGFMKMGYELLSEFYDLDGQRGTYYVKKDPGETLQHAALRYMLYGEALNNGLNAKTSFGSEADIQLETKRGKLVSIEVHDGTELKNQDAMLERINRFKKGGDVVVVTLEPDKGRYVRSLVGGGFEVVSPADAKTMFKRFAR